MFCYTSLCSLVVEVPLFTRGLLSKNQRLDRDYSCHPIYLRIAIIGYLIKGYFCYIIIVFSVIIGVFFDVAGKPFLFWAVYHIFHVLGDIVRFVYSIE